ncbi:Gfo/Idh/MocA family protein [Paenibacillus montanisoli]|uniref:Gfo/Idh/MocA family oxidoreductase n=1 Tax=Paenibacillus montanisoli TaxID=2081970 RepID=A0A328U012_9BACL|nr:Gfo/Idh/MocA family oxidoreductase [Paenibacillus montanisoli]RAP75970.1 gfo/Idh/MocA family oxidoreductase [Paenibacillus montanisoli]
MRSYAFVGAGNRGTYMYAVPMSRDYPEMATIVGVYDTNARRAALLRSRAGGHFPVYEDFTAMLSEAKPDVVIVTSIDSTHHAYIVQALIAGCDVITEKPLTIDEDKCSLILETERRTGKRVTVTFNLRYMPFMGRLKEMAGEGSLGTITHVHFEWFLDTKHGADYFRRWHRKKANSGGLLVHKSTHHFDIVNWVLADEPIEVHAFGSTRYYGPTQEERGVRCFGCDYAGSCEFHLDIREGNYKELYADCEEEDRYYRDGCVFADEIDIEDTVSLTVRYARGAMMSYSLTAYAPYEGFRIVFTGTKGRLEAEYLNGSTGPYAGQTVQTMRVVGRNNAVTEIPLTDEGGGHGGGDERLLRALLTGAADDRQASSLDGALSCAVGFAANRSIREGKPVRIADLNTF